MLARLMAPTFLALALLAAPLTAETQAAGKVPRIGYLSTGSATWNPFAEAFRQGLREAGWIEGQNIAIEYRYAKNRFDRLLDLAAELTRLKVDVIVASNPANPAQSLAITDLKVGARAPGVQLQLLEARGPNEFDGAFAAMAKERVGALLLLADSTLVVHRTRLADLAARDRLPAVYGVREHVDAGGLMGARPADLPVEQPTTFELVVNLETAKDLGLTIPPSLLARADEVIR